MNGVADGPGRPRYWQTASASTGSASPQAALPRWPIRPASNAFADPSAEGTIENTVTVTGGGLTDAVTATETLPAATEPGPCASPRRSSRAGQRQRHAHLYVRDRKLRRAAADAPRALPSPTASIRSCGGIAVTYNGDTWLPANYTTRHGDRSVPDRARRNHDSGRLRRSGSCDRRMDRYPRLCHPGRSPVRSDSSQPGRRRGGHFFRDFRLASCRDLCYHVVSIY